MKDEFKLLFRRNFSRGWVRRWLIWCAIVGHSQRLVLTTLFSYLWLMYSIRPRGLYNLPPLEYVSSHRGAPLERKIGYIFGQLGGLNGSENFVDGRS